MRAWKDEEEKNKISFKNIFQQQEMKPKKSMGKEVIKTKLNKACYRRNREEKKCNNS